MVLFGEEKKKLFLGVVVIEDVDKRGRVVWFLEIWIISRKYVFFIRGIN